MVFKGIDVTKVRRCRLREVCMHTVGMTAVTGVCKCLTQAAMIFAVAEGHINDNEDFMLETAQAIQTVLEQEAAGTDAVAACALALSGVCH